MAQKNNIRSIRFSDELAELIDRQTGDTFTEKFTNLITRCVWELPRKEEELKRLDNTINRKRQELRAMQEKLSNLTYTTNRIQQQAAQLEAAIRKDLQQWERKHE